MVTPPKAEPFDLQCDAGPNPCAGDCPALPEWTADGDFDALLSLAPQDRLVRDACVAKLRACQACLDRGREAGVIR